MLKRGNVLSVELTRAVQDVIRQHKISFQPRPGSQRRRRGGGGGGANSYTRYARVTVQADSDLGSTGKCVLLSPDMKPLDKGGGELILDPATSGYDATKVEEAEIEFKSADFVDHEVDDRVMLSCSGEINPGMTWNDDDDDSKVLSHKVEYPTTAEELTCQSVEMVTDIACVDGELVVTKDIFQVVTGPCP